MPFNRPEEPFSSRDSQSSFGRAVKHPPLLQARKVEHLPAAKGCKDVTYCVIENNAKLTEQETAGRETAGEDRRKPQRKRTRLRCGKVLDQHGKFLVECQVHDRSDYGAQLRLIAAISLPPRIKFFDDEQGALIDAKVIWRKKREIGIKFETKMGAQAIKSGQRSALGGKYYAVP